MTRPNYSKIYSVLGVFQDDDWDTVRAAYKRQIRRWHPDRFQDRDQRTIAEDKSKEINSAFQILDEYYRQFGELPPDERFQSDAATVSRNTDTGANPDPRPVHERQPDPGEPGTAPDQPATARGRSFGRLAMVGIVVLAVYLAFEESFTSSPTAPDEYQVGSRELQAGMAPQRETASDPPLGSARTEIPGHPADWQTPETEKRFASKPLHTGGRNAVIVVGSTKQEVLAIQGPPLRQTDTAWDYGLSRIHFRNGRVIDWYENPMNPLQVER